MHERRYLQVLVPEKLYKSFFDKEGLSRFFMDSRDQKRSALQPLSDAQHKTIGPTQSIASCPLLCKIRSVQQKRNQKSVSHKVHIQIYSPSHSNPQTAVLESLTDPKTRTVLPNDPVHPGTVQGDSKRHWSLARIRTAP